MKAEAIQSLFIATSSFGFLLQTTNMANKVKTEQGSQHIEDWKASSNM